MRQRFGDTPPKSGLESQGDEYDAGKGKLRFSQPKRSPLVQLVLTIVRVSILFLVANAVILTLVYFLAPCNIDPQVYEMPPPPPYTGPLARNEILSRAEHILEGEINAPESLALQGDKLYTGLQDGRVVEITKREITREIRFSKIACDTWAGKSAKCGRPLGVRMDPEFGMLVADAYLGIYQADIWQGTSAQLVSPDTVLEGAPMAFFNDLVIANGVVYFTHSSGKWDVDHVNEILFEANRDGRVIAYNMYTKETWVVINNMMFPNGIELSWDGNAILVSELGQARIVRYYIAGPKQGQIDFFAENLPGFPDNIRRSSNGSYWIPYAVTREQGRFSFLDWSQDKPWARKLSHQLTPKKLENFITKLATPPYGLITLHAEDGEMLGSLHDPSGKAIGGVSEVADAGSVLFLGSYSAPYIGKVEI